MKGITKNKRQKLNTVFKNLGEEDYADALIYIAEKFNELVGHQEPMSYRQISGKIENSVKVDKDIKELIGTIPYLFVSKKHFSSNRDLANFAQDLGIELPFWEKRSRSEIIGIVIIALSNMSQEKIRKLNRIVQKLISDRKAQDKEGFFTQWERAIKELKF